MRHLAVFLMVLNFTAAGTVYSEDIRINVSGIVELSKDKIQGETVPMNFNDTVLVALSKDTKFFSGVELELDAPQTWLSSQGVLAVVIYSKLEKPPSKGGALVRAEQLKLETLPNKIQNVYCVPIKKNHNIKSNPYITMLGNIESADFPLLFRLMPVVRDVGDDIQNMRFELKVKPILSDEGSVKINIHYPGSLPGKNYSILIDDKVIDKTLPEHFFKEGEHHLMLISADYRNESRRFIIERGKSLELNISLQDLTPLVIFETPDNARVFVDGVRFPNTTAPKALEAGPHEVKIQVSDYTILKDIYVHKGKTYRISFIVDLDVLEED